MRKTKRNGKTVWEQDFGDDDQVLDLGLDSDSNFDDEDGVDVAVLDKLDAEDEKLLNKSNRLLKTAKDFQDSDEDDFLVDRESVGANLKTRQKKASDINEDEAILAWGHRRKAFYNRDDEVISDEEAAREELAETRKMQQRRMEVLNEADFLGDDDEYSAAPTKATFGDSFVKILRGTAKNTAATSSDDIDNDDFQVEKVENSLKRDALAKMDLDALKLLANSQIPTVVRYLEEFNERWDEVKNVLGPALKWMKENDDKVEAGLVAAKKYLVLKYGIATNRTGPGLSDEYFVLSHNSFKSAAITHSNASPIPPSNKVEGRKDESKKSLESSTGKHKRNNIDSDSETTSLSGGFPNLLDKIADFVESRLFGEDEEGYENDDYEDDDTLRNNSMLKDDFDEENDGEKEGDLLTEEEVKAVLTEMRERGGSKKSASSAAKFLLNPPKASTVNNDVFQIPKFVSAKSTMSKGKKSKLKSVNIDVDFGETDLNDIDMTEKMAKRRDLQFHVKRIDQDISKRKKNSAMLGGTGDDDLPMRDKNGKLVLPAGSASDSKKKDPGAFFSILEPEVDNNEDIFGGEVDNSALDDEDYYGEDVNDFDSGESSGKRKREGDDDDVEKDDEDDEALAYYNSIANVTKASKDEKEAAFQEYKKSLEGDGPYNDNDMAATGLKRATGWTIDANKGLTPRRKKEDRNSRVKIRNKFAKKQKKLGSIKAIVKDKSKTGVYRGEATGIKSQLSKSVRF
ncbi:hypothetical protein HK100_003593 [Physocladia obscura]|uniref:Sas10 C-terminal domain-containing protein n=1 Tax=Physocladia obscura TaxID=109957 RepID=A0AAD5T6N3_9FUNG|nr:hypothetical protein HK100_003593 [Physocladia obscura]